MVNTMSPASFQVIIGSAPNPQRIIGRGDFVHARAASLQLVSQPMISGGRLPLCARRWPRSPLPPVRGGQRCPPLVFGCGPSSRRSPFAHTALLLLNLGYCLEDGGISV